MAELPEAKVAKSGDGTGGGTTRRKPYKRRLKNYLLDRNLQLRYIATITLVSALIAGVLGFMIWRQGSETSDNLVEMTESTFGEEGLIDDDVASELSDNDSKLVYQMVAFGIGLALILSFFLLIMAHKVAGPLYKLSHHFDDLARGKYREVRSLRRLDMLHGFHQKFEDTHAALREQLEADIGVMDRFIAAADTAGVERSGKVGDALSALEAHIEERDGALEHPSPGYSRAKKES